MIRYTIVCELDGIPEGDDGPLSKWLDNERQAIEQKDISEYDVITIADRISITVEAVDDTSKGVVTNQSGQ